MELQKSKMSEQLEVQHKEDGVTPLKGDGYDVAHTAETSADFIDLVKEPNQPHLATIDEQGAFRSRPLHCAEADSLTTLLSQITSTRGASALPRRMDN